MRHLFIDAGTYSVKFLKCRLRQGKIVPSGIQSVLLAEARAKAGPEASVADLQTAVIKERLGDGFQGKVSLQVPGELVTSRFIQLPVVNRKKAGMMIPFQLDSQLPYPVSAAHYAFSLKKEADHFKSMICITKRDEFASLHKRLGDADILPNVLTTELAVMDHFAKSSSLTFPHAIIDFGHSTTKVYLIEDGTVACNHVSHVGGKAIDSLIAKTYNIPMAEVVPYKHKNCFFLTENQYDEVDENQKEFAWLMKQVVWPLVKEIRRWVLGHRTKFGTKIEKFFIIGGSSNIKNVTNFFSQALEAKVGHLSVSNHYSHPPAQVENDESGYALATMMTTAELARGAPFNMLHGDFSTEPMNKMPLHSTAFVAVRTAVASVVLCLLLLAERLLFLSGGIKESDRDIMTKLRTPSLKMSQAQRASYRRDPSRVLAVLRDKNEELAREVASATASVRRNAAAGLVLLSRTIGGDEGAELMSFFSDDGTSRAIVRCDDEPAAQRVRAAVERAAPDNLSIARQGLTLTVTFDGNAS